MANSDLYDYLLKVEEICHVGLKYSKDPYARDNYSELQKRTKDFISSKLGEDFEGDNFFKRDVYPTASVSVRTVIFNAERDQVLLVQEKSDGGYSLPGGWSEIGLTPAESALKEVREEAGSICKLTRLVGTFNRHKQIMTCCIPEYIIVFEGEIEKKVSEPCFEITSCGFFPLSSLPKWSKKNNPEQMEKILALAQDKKTGFD